MADKRTTLILNYIKQNKRATLQELCELFPSYSTMTIRRDLILLEKNGYIRRFHGGAELCGDAMADLYNYQQRKASALKEKQYIAMRAAELLEESSSIYIDAGTTMLEMVKILPDMPLFITTNDPFVLFEGLKKRSLNCF